MRTAGLDALIFHRAFTLGVLFFAPVTVLGLTACEAFIMIFDCNTPSHD